MIRPRIVQAFIKRPKHCRTLTSFDSILYRAKQMVRTKQREAGILREFFFSSLSSQTIIYKALSTSKQLAEFYPDLRDPEFKTSFGVFHRRFSTNTLSNWDKVQPFRLIAHNGEINTIEGNRLAAISREKALGLRVDELVTHMGSSDSGNFNGMVEALKYRSSIPNIAEILAIMTPPAGTGNSEYFRFWSRAMESWDGPALIAFCDGKRIGARLDRNGFRPCRWLQTKENFYLASEVGCFEVEPKNILRQGTLYAGRSVSIHIMKGEISFSNPDVTPSYETAHFDCRLIPLDYMAPAKMGGRLKEKSHLFHYTKEDLQKVLYPMIQMGKEPIGSMGDTARPSVLSHLHRSVYDYIYQNFAQVTNPPLDYIREKMVTDLNVFLGRKPNIFEPKELIPPPKALNLNGPILSLGQMEYVENIEKLKPEYALYFKKFDTLFDKSKGVEGFNNRIDEIVGEVVSAVNNGIQIVCLSDREATQDKLPIPAILIMRAVQLKLNSLGLRLRVSILIDSGEIRDAHQVAVLIGFGASAVCPYLALDISRNENLPGLEQIFPDEREKRLINALESGVLRVMAKSGISVLRSYQGAELFTLLGLAEDITKKYFPGHKSLIGGLNFKSLVQEIISRSDDSEKDKVPHNYLYKEHSSGRLGEVHSMTSKRARVLHEALAEDFGSKKAMNHLEKFSKEVTEKTVNIRHLMTYKKKSHRLVGGGKYRFNS